MNVSKMYKLFTVYRLFDGILKKYNSYFESGCIRLSLIHYNVRDGAGRVAEGINIPNRIIDVKS